MWVYLPDVRYTLLEGHQCYTTMFRLRSCLKTRPDRSASLWCDLYSSLFFSPFSHAIHCSCRPCIVSAHFYVCSSGEEMCCLFFLFFFREKQCVLQPAEPRQLVEYTVYLLGAAAVWHGCWRFSATDGQFASVNLSNFVVLKDFANNQATAKAKLQL